jgi:DNA-binding LytR/AlgR family response regulator
MLPQDGFIRIHRSYIVTIEKIKAYSASQVEIDNKKLPIGNTYKSPVLKRLDFLSKG